LANILYWVAAIGLFGIVILVHELGHFWAAKLTGIPVVEFAVGLGPKIFARRSKAGVLFTLRVFPIGGFCRFVGDGEDGEEDGLGHPRAYYKEKIWKRAAVSLSGPLMNYIAAFVFLMIIFMGIGVQSIDHTVGEVTPSSPAEMAGLLPGDRFAAIDGQAVASPQEATERISAAQGAEMLFAVQRGQEQVELRIRPEWDEAEGRAMIGIRYGTHIARLGLADSARTTWGSIQLMSRLVVDLIRDAIFRGEGTQNFASPIGVAVDVRRETQEGGLPSYLFIASLISVNLGLFNLLPIPGLDGCKLIFLLIEKIRGKRLDPNKEGVAVLVGFALLAGLMVVVMYQDIVRLVGG